MKAISILFILFSTLLFASSVELSLQEKEFIKKHPKIVLGTGDSWSPYSIKQKDGTIIGYDNDILTKINKATGANFVQQLGDWSKMQELAKENKIDGLSTLAALKQREKWFIFSDVYISLKKMVLVKKGNPLHVKSDKDLDGKTIVVHRGNRVDENLAKQFKNSKIIFASTPKEMLEEVIYGKADATFGNGATEYLLSQLGLPYLDLAYPLESSLDLVFALRKEWAIGMSILNKGLATISEHERVQLKQKWFGSNIQEKKISPIKLSQEQKKYLKNKKIIKMCVDPNWMPFEGIENGNYIGISSDYVKLFSELIDTPIVLVQTETWTQSLEKIKSKDCDILAMAEQTPARDEYMNFTKSYIKTPIVVATKIGVPFIDDIKLIKDKKLGIEKGYSTYELLKSKYPDINLVEVNSLKDGLNRVEKGQLFGFIDNIIVLNHQLQNTYLGTIAITGKLKENIKLSVATRDDEPMLNTIFQKAISAIDTKTKLHILNKWVDINYKKETDYTLVWQILAVGGVLSLFFLYRQFVVGKLNKELDFKLKKELKKSKEKDLLIYQQQKLASMGEMLENIAHQWRQPLSQINSAVLLVDEEMFQKKFKNSLIETKLNEIESMTKYMSNTIDDFKSFHKNKGKEQKFYLKKSIETVLSLVKSSMAHNNITVELDIDEVVLVKGFNNEFEQALLVILNNAKDAIKSKNPHQPKITIKITKVEKSYILNITDNGGGIKEENLDKIFEPYFTTKHQSQGTGVGLYLAKMIIEESMGAKLHVKNVENSTCFSIDFGNYCS